MIPYQTAIQQFMANKPVKRAYLFGSQARGEANQNSDIDMLVELGANVSIVEFARIQLQLEKFLQRKVDLVSSIGLSPFVEPFIQREKILIYAKED